MAVNRLGAAAGSQEKLSELRQLKQEKAALENEIARTKAQKSSEIDQSIDDLEQEKHQVEQQISVLETSSPQSNGMVADRPTNAGIGPAYQAAISPAGAKASVGLQNQKAQDKKDALLSSMLL